MECNKNHFARIFGNAFEHGMSGRNQNVHVAEQKWNKFMTDCVNEARALSDRGRSDNNYRHIKNALELLGKAVHALADSYSPPHEGFAAWAIPYLHLDMIKPYISAHKAGETLEVYTKMKSTVDNAIIDRFRADFLYIIKE